MELGWGSYADINPILFFITRVGFFFLFKLLLIKVHIVNDENPKAIDGCTHAEVDTHTNKLAKQEVRNENLISYLPSPLTLPYPSRMIILLES